MAESLMRTRVVDLEFLFETAQNRDRVVDRRLADHHRLEAARESGVFLDVLAVFRERGGADAAQFAARQRRLQHVGRVDRAFRSAGADQRVQLVDEADDFAVRFGDFLENGLQAVFEFAAELGARDHLAEVDRDQFLVAQLIGHVALENALRETFDDGGFTDARLADQHRIVLGAAAQNLHHAANLFVAADHRIELAAPGLLGQIDGIALQRLILRFRILIRHTLRAAYGHQRFQNGVVIRAQLVQQAPGGFVFLIGEREQQVLGRHVLVLEILRFFERAFENLIQGRRNVHSGLLPRDLGDRRQLAFRFADQRVRLDAALLEDRPHDALALTRQRDKEMQWMHCLMSVLTGDFLRLLNGFLSLLGQFVKSEWHFFSFSYDSGGGLPDTPKVLAAV